MEFQTREEDTPPCLAIVTYTGASTDPETNNWHGGVLAVNQVPVLTVDDCVNKIGVWSEAQLWRADGKGTTDEFFEESHLPCTRRTVDQGIRETLWYSAISKL